MEDPTERARKLVALATNKGASSEEARSAAMAACRLIVKHKLLDGAADHGRPGPPNPQRRPARARHSAQERARPSYRAARPGHCAFCAKPFVAEDDVMTNADGSVDHWHCAKRRASGAEPGSI